jgi:hypothetical protein
MNGTTNTDGDATGTITGANAIDLGIATQYEIHPIWTEFKNYIICCYFHRYTRHVSFSSERGYYEYWRIQRDYISRILPHTLSILRRWQYGKAPQMLSILSFLPKANATKNNPLFAAALYMIMEVRITVFFRIILLVKTMTIKSFHF